MYALYLALRELELLKSTNSLHTELYEFISYPFDNSTEFHLYQKHTGFMQNI